MQNMNIIITNLVLDSVSIEDDKDTFIINYEITS